MKRRCVIAMAMLLIAFHGDAVPMEPHAVAGRKEAAVRSQAGYRVVSVIDGDTFRIRKGGKVTSVRLIGVDAPESHHVTDAGRNTRWGRAASRYARKWLKGRTVYLSFDRARYDRYGRLLAYAYLKDARGRKAMFNETLVRNGYARAACYEPNHKHRKTFERLQKQARKKKKGFWKDGLKAAFPAL